MDVKSKNVGCGKKVTAAIDMISDIEYDDIASDIEMRIKREPQKTIEQFFAGIVNKKLVSAAAKSINADINMSVGEAGKEMCFLIVKQLKNFIFNITGYKGFENAQVCQGGIELSQINPDTMESLNTKGLYFAGELIDVDAYRHQHRGDDRGRKVHPGILSLPGTL